MITCLKLIKKDGVVMLVDIYNSDKMGIPWELEPSKTARLSGNNMANFNMAQCNNLTIWRTD
jgi:hypothetical protein